jgi:hypothetical protein
LTCYATRVERQIQTAILLSQTRELVVEMQTVNEDRREPEVRGGKFEKLSTVA